MVARFIAIGRHRWRMLSRWWTMLGMDGALGVVSVLLFGMFGVYGEFGAVSSSEVSVVSAVRVVREMCRVWERWYPLRGSLPTAARPMRPASFSAFLTTISLT